MLKGKGFFIPFPFSRYPFPYFCKKSFKRLCGVRPETFNQMVEIVRCLRRATPTQKPKLNLPERLLQEVYCKSVFDLVEIISVDTALTFCACFSGVK